MTASRPASTAARAAWWIAGALALLAVWGHWETVGSYDANAPNRLREVTTWRVGGRWDYLVRDPEGLHPQSTGLAIGLVFSWVVVRIVWRRGLGRGRRTAAPR